MGMTETAVRIGVAEVMAEAEIEADHKATPAHRVQEMEEVVARLQTKVGAEEIIPTLSKGQTSPKCVAIIIRNLVIMQKSVTVIQDQLMVSCV